MAPMTLAPTPVTGLRVQAGGDCHLANFGGRGGRGLEERMMRRKLELTCILIALAATAGCGKSQETGYVPGLGELMAGQQVRHTKLWFARRKRKLAPRRLRGGRAKRGLRRRGEAGGVSYTR